VDWLANEMLPSMQNVRRIDPEGRPVFVTQVTRHRLPLLAGLEPLLLEVIAELRVEFGMRVFAHVILPDHLHLIVHGSSDFGAFIQSLKLRMVRRHRLQNLWQRRFYDHVIRNEDDLRRHLDYVHYNPVKHGLTARPEDYPYTSFRRYQALAWYLPGWGHVPPVGVSTMELE